MATERVYSPDTSEPFDVPATKARDLVLNQGWTRTPWTRVEAEPAPAVVVEETSRGRGRRRRVIEEAPIAADEDVVDVPEVVDEDDNESWRS